MNKLINKTSAFIVALIECDNDKEITTYLNQLVELDTPKKPIIIERTKNSVLFKCPSCNKRKGYCEIKHCDSCGQLLKWSDTK